MLKPGLGVIYIHIFGVELGTTVSNKPPGCSIFSINIGTNEVYTSGGVVVSNSPGDKPARIILNCGDKYGFFIVFMQDFYDKSPKSKKCGVLYRSF